MTSIQRCIVEQVLRVYKVSQYGIFDFRCFEAAHVRTILFVDRQERPTEETHPLARESDDVIYIRICEGLEKFTWANKLKVADQGGIVSRRI